MDKILSRHPVNKTASIVTGKGYRYQPDKKIACVESDYPLPTKPIPFKHVKNIPNFKGQKFGRLTVMGLSADIPKRWVARCDCGRYTIRTAKAIRNENNKNDCCQMCAHVDYLRRKSLYLDQLGRSDG